MEFLIIGVILIVIVFFSLMHYFNMLVILQIGVILIVTGLLFGVPAGCYYHFLLFSRKKQTNFKIKKWWITPHKYHKYFSDGDQRILNKWFFAGAVLCNISLAGCFLVFLYFISRN
tara:strand:- start:17811 stop:18158 length:348 start_codon:yes stop_codon:yes gene_type:complete